MQNGNRPSVDRQLPGRPEEGEEPSGACCPGAVKSALQRHLPGVATARRSPHGLSADSGPEPGRRTGTREKAPQFQQGHLHSSSGQPTLRGVPTEQWGWRNSSVRDLGAVGTAPGCGPNCSQGESPPGTERKLHTDRRGPGCAWSNIAPGRNSSECSLVNERTNE